MVVHAHLRTRWTNEQVLFHMVFGYMIVQRLLILVKVFGCLPDQVSRAFAGLLSAATRPFDVINYYGSCSAALVYNRRRMGAKIDRIIAALQRKLAREPEGRAAPRHALPHPLGPLLQGLHDPRRRPTATLANISTSTYTSSPLYSAAD